MLTGVALGWLQGTGGVDNFAVHVLCICDPLKKECDEKVVCVCVRTNLGKAVCIWEVQGACDKAEGVWEYWGP